MKDKIKVSLDKNSYDILIGSKMIDDLSGFLAQKHYSKIFIITDTNVAKLYLDDLKQKLSTFAVKSIIIANGENSKNFANLENICEEILKNNIDRKSLLIALGGGVVGDLTGFVASILLRGIDFIQIPTTLLACVDSSVGGKTAINSKSGKNLIGSFYQPKLVICDLDFLTTLPLRELRAGYAEVLKYGLIEDRNFFDYLNKNIDKILAKDTKSLHYIIKKSCEIKAKIVALDEKESNIRALLNFGHTFGHVFEIETNYSDKLLHGEAVAIGMLMAARMSQNLALLNDNDYQLIASHINKSGLNINLSQILSDIDINKFVQHLYKDKKTENGLLTFILLTKIGAATIKKGISEEEFTTTVKSFLISHN